MVEAKHDAACEHITHPSQYPADVECLCQRRKLMREHNAREKEQMRRSVQSAEEHEARRRVQRLEDLGYGEDRNY